MPSKPGYLHHKPTGQARVRIDGKDHYLGPYGSPESRERYEDLIAEWFARQGDVVAYTLKVDELCLMFMNFADGYYRRKDGTSTGTVTSIRSAFKYLIRLYGTVHVRDFEPRKLKAVRQALPRSQPASGLRRQPELCQKSEEETALGYRCTLHGFGVTCRGHRLGGVTGRSNSIRCACSLGYRPPAPEAVLTNQTTC